MSQGSKGLTSRVTPEVDGTTGDVRYQICVPEVGLRLLYEVPETLGEC